MSRFGPLPDPAELLDHDEAADAFAAILDDPALDAEVIAVADRAYRSVGLDGFRLEVSSLGDSTCRPGYRAKLQEFLFALDLDEETRRRRVARGLPPEPTPEELMAKQAALDNQDDGEN